MTPIEPPVARFTITGARSGFAHGYELVRRESPADVEADLDLMANTGVLVSRDLLLDRVWGQEYPGGTRTVDVHVAQLRRKLGRPELIRTLRGAGYKAVAP